MIQESLRKPAILVVGLFAILSLSSLRLPAQAVAVVQVSGMATDPSGAAVVGVQVTMTEIDKDIQHATITDSVGRYVLPNLPTGPYKLEAKASGFKDYVQSGIVLQVGSNIQINIPLQVGLVTETVEVTAVTSMVETKENSVSLVIDEHGINDLPLNGRQASALVLALGASSYGDAGDTGSKTFYSSTRISVAGGQSNGTAYLLDGGDNTDAMSNVNLPFPFPDALQEFSVETSAVSSRFGIHPGATVNVVTKSGSNQLHGDIFDYLRNGDMNARNFFAPRHDSLKRNQFGGTAGGKIIADKLFFFGGYQGTRQRTDPPQTTSYIPTPVSLTGDFSGLASAGCQSSGKALQLIDPSNNQPFANNQIPISRLNPQTLKIASSYLPVTNDPCGKIVYGIPTLGDEDQVIGRIDYVQSSKNTLFGRYFMDQYSNPPVFDGHNLLTTTQAGNLERAQSVTLGDTYTFGPGTMNSLHLTYNRRRDDRGPTDIPINPTLLGVKMYSAVPNFLLLNVRNYFSTFCGTCAPGHFNVNSMGVADDVDVIRGRHEMAFGFNFLRVQNNTISGFNENGTFTFDGSLTKLGLADFLLGRPSDFMQTNATPDDLRQSIMSVYAQDTFHVSPRITLNFGLRWEPTFPDPDKYGRGSSFSLPAFYAGQFSTVYKNAPAGMFFYGDKGIPKAMWNGHLANFAPRAGLVWNVHGNGKDTIRIGGALLYDAVETWFNERETTNAPYGGNIDIPFPVGGFSDPYLNYPGGSPFPNNGRAIFPIAGVYVNMPLNPNPTYVAQWNVTYQRQFAGNWLASVSYLGNKTTHLWIDAGEINPAVYIPGTCNGSPCSTTGNTNQRRILYRANEALGASYASINTADDGAVAHYQAMLLSIRHSFSSHFTLSANYTDSYCISDRDFGAALATASNSVPFSRGSDRGPCIFDVRHNFNTTLVAVSSVKRGLWTSRLLSNWQFAPLLHVASGQPLTVTTGKDQSLTGLNNDRPVQVLLDPYPSNKGVQWVNPLAFTPNALGTFGNVGRNALRGPGALNMDVGLSRIFKLTERFNLEARAEAFNVINHTNFVGAISPAGGTSYTTMNTNSSSSAFGKVQSAFDPRIMQFALKVHF